ncbi:hypothetical protein DL93DRAFT_2082607 [Clavulina sp. PMI_390]|nr:hypothetical protein DL93DRAFT_2082607 [Clavulina sp. PMI_390]
MKYATILCSTLCQSADVVSFRSLYQLLAKRTAGIPFVPPRNRLSQNLEDHQPFVSPGLVSGSAGIDRNRGLRAK